jgi:hypothetical protein
MNHEKTAAQVLAKLTGGADTYFTGTTRYLSDKSTHKTYDLVHYTKLDGKIITLSRMTRLSEADAITVWAEYKARYPNAVCNKKLIG